MTKEEKDSLMQIIQKSTDAAVRAADAAVRAADTAAQAALTAAEAVTQILKVIQNIDLQKELEDADTEYLTEN